MTQEIEFPTTNNSKTLAGRHFLAVVDSIDFNS